MIQNLRYYPGVCLDRQTGLLAEIRIRDLSQHEAGMPPTLPPRSVFKLQINYSRLNGSKQFPNLICS